MTQINFDELSKKLEETGNFHVLRKICRPNYLLNAESRSTEHIGIIIDLETTGLSPASDEIIEIGMVKFSYDPRTCKVQPISEFQRFNQPSKIISPEVTELTGITNEMVAGKSISPEEVEEYVSDATIIIAHNANFDRKFCENNYPIFSQKSWACTMTDISWKKEDISSLSLEFILYKFRLFYDPHRAINDCYAVFAMLSKILPKSNKLTLEKLLENSKKISYNIWAESAPYDMKDLLKERRYKWSDGTNRKSKAWWTSVSEEDLELELEFLKKHIYKKEFPIKMQKITAKERYSERDF